LHWITDPAEVTLTSPYGGEQLTPGTTQLISWSASTGDAGSWQVEFSPNGQSWEPVVAGLSGGKRTAIWNTPVGVETGQLRVVNTELAISDQTDASVELVPAPTGLTTNELCASSLKLSWQPVAGATAYEVYRFDGELMSPISTVVDTSVILEDLLPGDELLLSVTAVTANSKSSRRSFALATTHSGNGEPCAPASSIAWNHIDLVDNGSYIDVLWEVGRESGITHYELQRNSSGEASSGWETLQSISAVGDFASGGSYQLVDEQPLTAGTFLYRLLAQGADEKQHFSEVITHQRLVSGTSEVAEISLLQNPVGDLLTLTNSTQREQVVELFDIVGRRVAVFSLSSGTSQMAWPAELGAGWYVLRTRGLSKSQSIKLLRQ
jgi:hypothetical protein